MRNIDLTSETAVKLVDNATELFNEFGYAGTSINDIAKKAELSKGILYHYFSNKDELYIFCLKKCITDFIDFMEQNIPKTSIDTENLIKVVELRFVFFDKNPQYKNLFHNLISSKPSHLSKEILETRQILTESNIKFLEILSNKISLGKGVLDSDVILFVTMLQNSSTFLMDNDNDEKKRKENINSLVRLTSIFLNGLKNDLHD